MKKGVVQSAITTVKASQHNLPPPKIPPCSQVHEPSTVITLETDDSSSDDETRGTAAGADLTGGESHQPAVKQRSTAKHKQSQQPH